MNASHDSELPPREPLVVRLHRALGPLAGAMLLDFVDLVTFGPIGLFGGFLLGAAVGWWISSIYEFTTRGRALFAALAALYTAIPFTEPIPVATIIAALARFREREPPALPESSPAREESSPLSNRQRHGAT
jgi:hypothetical protein